MAQKSKPHTVRKSSYRGFEGVDQKKTHSGDESISLIENFRITDDGSLKKRYGFKRVYDGPEEKSEITASYSIEKNKEAARAAGITLSSQNLEASGNPNGKPPKHK